jgi:meso-butanediol dehydrogenase / (S,S)-butanediol dehydrogenase / diacetyl reductase
MTDLQAGNQEFQGKVAFIMGGSSGLGLASATLLAQRGASVTIFGHAPDTLAIARDLSANGLNVYGVHGDGASSEAVKAAIAETVSRFGELDIIVNSAAIHPMGDVVATDEETWDRTMAVNLKTMYLTCHYGVPHLIKRGGGAIVNFASVQATSCSSGVCAYATSKGAIISFTHTLAVDLAKYQIRANTICPGPFKTPMQDHFAKMNAAGRSREEMFQIFAKPVPLQRLGEPWEAAELTAFLAGPRSAFCTGGEFTADGGLLAGLRIH